VVSAAAGSEAGAMTDSVVDQTTVSGDLAPASLHRMAFPAALIVCADMISIQGIGHKEAA
jgi:hypothetical protein